MSDVPQKVNHYRAVPLPLPSGRKLVWAVALFGLIALPSLSGCAAPGIQADPVYFPPPPTTPHVVHLKSFNRLDQIVPRRVGLLEALRGGPARPFVGKPAGIAFRDGHLFLCDTELNLVHDWDLATGKARRIGNRGDVLLSKPVAVAVDDGGQVYVADTGRGEVVEYDATGKYVGRFRRSGEDGYRPVALIVSDDRLYVADIGAHRIDVFSTDDGARVGEFGGTGSDPGRFYFPMGVATNGASSDIVVSDTMNSRVQVFSPSFNLLRTFGQAGNRYGDMGKPRHLAVGPDGVVFVADVEFAHVHLFNERGQLLMLLGGPEDKTGGTPMPVGVTVATSLPEPVAALVPDGFRADYFLFVTNSVAKKRISLYAVGTAR